MISAPKAKKGPKGILTFCILSLDPAAKNNIANVPIKEEITNVSHHPIGPKNDPIMHNISISPSPTPSICLYFLYIHDIPYKKVYAEKAPMTDSKNDRGSGINNVVIKGIGTKKSVVHWEISIVSRSVLVIIIKAEQNILVKIKYAVLSM